MKARIIIYFVLICAVLYSNNLFSQQYYYAVDRVKIDQSGEKMYSILNNKLVVFDIKSQQIIKIIEVWDDANYTLDLNGDKLIVANEQNCCVIDLSTDEKIKFDINEKSSKYEDVWIKLSLDNSKIFIAREYDNSVKVYDATTGKFIENAYSLKNASITGMAMSPDKKTIATTTADFHSKKVKYQFVFWDIETKKELKSVSLPGKPKCLKFNSDGSQIALGFDESDIDEYAKFFTNCLTDKRYKLGIWLFDTKSKKFVKKLPVLQISKSINDIEFDYNNKDIIYSSYNDGTYSYNVSTNKCSGIYEAGNLNLSFFKDYLISIKGGFNNKSVLFINTKEKDQNLKFKHFRYEPFYINENFVNAGSSSPFLFIMYDYNTTDVKWLFINKDGDYDCYGDMDEFIKSSYFPNLKPLQRKQGLLKQYSNPTFDRQLAQFLYNNKWDGERAKKEVFEYSGIPFDYYEIFKMKRPEVVLPDRKLTDQEWEEQATLAREKLIQQGFIIVEEKLSNTGNFIISVNVEDDNTGLACVALCENGPGEIIIDGRPTSSRKNIALKKEKGLLLYSNYNISTYKAGKYIFEIYPNCKSYLIVASKKGAQSENLSKAETENLMIQSTIQDMEQKGYKVIETRTATVGFGKPLIIPIEFGGEFAWTAISPDKCGTLNVFTNGVSNGQTFVKNDFAVNSGTVGIKQDSKIEFRTNVTGCNSAKVTITIAVIK